MNANLTDTVTVAAIEELVESLDLAYGNDEVFEQGDELFVWIEAPQHTTLQVVVKKTDAIEKFLGNVLTAIRDYSARDTFDEIWSGSFGDHNGFSARQFLEILEEDGEYFTETSRYIAAQKLNA